MANFCFNPNSFNLVHYQHALLLCLHSRLGLLHGITKYGIHSFTQITLAMDKELMN